MSVLLALTLLSGVVRADLGESESLVAPYPAHWVWVGDPILERTALVDLETERLLGVVSSGYRFPLLLHPAGASEFYTIDMFFSRKTRGTRTDAVTVYDATSLEPTAEIVIPPKRAVVVTTRSTAAIEDEGRFLAVFNLTPATSLSVVDLRERRFVRELETPGCSLVYAAGPRRFAMLCMDGALLVIDLDETGAETRRHRSEPFFDPQEDPVTEKAARWGSRWIFVSFEGFAYSVDLAGERPVFEERWSLFQDGDRSDDWRIGGTQHLAVHQASGRLYSLVHQGGPHTHKQAGTEVWVYDLAKRERLQRIELESSGLALFMNPIDDEGFAGGLLHWLAGQAMGSVPELAISEIAVTQEARPRLVTIGQIGGVAHYDADSGELLGRAYPGNITNAGLSLPGASGRGVEVGGASR